MPKSQYQKFRESTLKGVKSAIELSQDLGVEYDESKGSRIDVFESIRKSGLVLLFRPLENLLGAFVKFDDRMGVILNSERPLGMQRFTASHELGHFALNHYRKFKNYSIFPRGPFDYSNFFQENIDISDIEREAHSFAAYFLLPPKLIYSHIAKQGWNPENFNDPNIVYQASLRFGASYEATIFGLQREKIVNREIVKKLLNVKPKDIKLSLLGEIPFVNSNFRDVWHLTEKDDGITLEVGTNDILIFELNEIPSAGYLWNFNEFKNKKFSILEENYHPFSNELVGSSVKRRIVIAANEPVSINNLQIQLHRPWESEQIEKTLRFHYKPTPSHHTFLYAS